MIHQTQCGTMIPDNPYGVTIYNANAAIDELLLQLIADMQTLGLRWLRFQIPWNAIESPQGTYNWTILDNIVEVASAAHINTVYSGMQPPSWGKDSNGLPEPTHSATFYTQLATRYNGQNGHGYLDALEIFNEEFDNTSFANTTYPAVANAVYTAIKNAGFTGKIGCASMLGISSSTHVTNWINRLYSNSIASLFDYFSLHYYNGPNDPSQTGTFLSIDATLTAIKNALVANNDPNKALWITEFGYGTSTNGGHPAIDVISPALQSQYYSYILEAARKSGIVQKIMFYSMDLAHDNTDGSSITQGIVPNETFLPAFSTVQQEIAAHPQW